MSQLDDLLRDLVVANRILSNEDVVDAYGHISVRHPDNPKRFFLSRSLAPELVDRHDLIEFDQEGEPVRSVPIEVRVSFGTGRQVKQPPDGELPCTAKVGGIVECVIEQDS